MEIFAALTGKSLGFVDFIEAQTIADFLKLPSRWHLQICDVNKVVLLDSDLANARQAAYDKSILFENDRQVGLADASPVGPKVSNYENGCESNIDRLTHPYRGSSRDDYPLSFVEAENRAAVVLVFVIQRALEKLAVGSPNT
jgi:hypothetical protein